MVAENIILIGFMGSGKSSVGRLVSQKLNYRFVDTDRLIVRDQDMPITEIFEKHGESYFRDTESRILDSLNDAHHKVIATGGGIILKPENRLLLQKLGMVVWLTADEETIFKRVARNKKRPLLKTSDPKATISQLLQQRLPMYRETAHCTIDTSSLSHEEVAEKIIEEAKHCSSAKM